MSALRFAESIMRLPCFFSGLAIFGEGAKGFSPATITRLKEVWQKEYNEWARRRLDGKEYVYVWADGIYCNACLDDQKLCLLVIIGVTVDGKKELVAVHQGGDVKARNPGLRFCVT